MTTLRRLIEFVVCLYMFFSFLSELMVLTLLDAVGDGNGLDLDGGGEGG